MKMHEHDQDIIMALAEGSLDPEAAARAEAAISACDQCQADLELQRLALTALQDAPAVYLTAAESGRLHDQLHRELRIAPAETARARLRPAWGRWAALAAGTAAVFLAAFLVLPSVLGGDDDADTVAFEQIEDELGAGADGRTATTAAAAEAPSAAVQSDDAADMGMALEESAPTTTVLPAETTAIPETMVDAGDGAALVYRVQGSLTEDLRREVADQLLADAGFFKMADDEAQNSRPDWAACVTTLFDLEDGDPAFTPQIIGSITDEVGEERILLALIDSANAADVALASVTIPECEIYETVP